CDAGTATTHTITGNLVIGGGGTFTGNLSTINLAGNFTNGGAFTANTSTVVCNGSTGQTIGGGSVTAFNNLTISNSAGVTLAKSASANAFLLSAGILTTTATNLLTITGTASSNVVRNGGYV